MAHRGAPSSFNDLHTEFVTTEEGTTLSELLQVLGSISITPILVPLIIPWTVPPSFVKQAVSNKDFFLLIRAILEYPVLAILPIWIITVFTSEELDHTNYITYSGVIFIILFCIAAGILVVNHAITAPKWFGFKEQWNKIKDLPTGWSKTKKEQKEEGNASHGKLPFITNYRAIVIYITVLSILAVDFIIFPRRFAKTKTYGVSLMDVGTGCFVFANGIVAPEARNKRSPLSTSMKSTIPIVILGFIRLITVKGIEYQEVVEEYGVHWNFFLTLAGIKVLSSLLFAIFDSAHGLKLATSVTLLYQLILKYDDLEGKFILNPKVNRGDSLLHANREGIFSVLGYLSIYLASVYFGKLIMWKTRTSVRDWTEYALQTLLQILNFVLWGLYFISTTYGDQPCRRSANLSYILLMVALNYSLLWGQMFLALVLVSIQHLGLIFGPIIFYELDAFHKRQASRLQSLQRMSKDFSKVKRDNREDTQNDDIDEQLQSLDDRLNATFEKIKTCEPGTPSESKLREEIFQIENEIARVESSLGGDNSDQVEGQGQSDDGMKGKNLVLMPDLSTSPVILESICYNGLAIFLLGNLLTGLINSMIYTMYTAAYLSLCYLWFYATVIYAVSITLYWYRIQLKFW